MTVRIVIGDCREKLRELPDGSVHTCVTSPPYFGLRDYGTGSWEGGDPACEHSVGGQVPDGKAPGAITAGVRPGVDASVCRRCGAARSDKQIGLEATPDAFVEQMVEVFREVRRVLRDDGTLWLNLGDSYAAGKTGRTDADRDLGGGGNKLGSGNPGGGVQRKPVLGLKHKDLIGIPWRVAFALQADGWYLRQDIIWAKPNPMPESVRDRCTKAHEYLFLLSKGPRYHFDADAIREASVSAYDPNNCKAPDGWDTGAGGHGAFHRDGRQKGATGQKARVRGVPPRHSEYDSSDQSGLDDVARGAGRNKRSVWTVATAPFAEAHFATYPPELVEPCILASCPEGGTVLDPFGGAGTTGLVADRLQRDAILIELNPAYAAIAQRRLEGDGGLFSDVVAA